MLLILGLMTAGCGSDEFDDTSLLKDLSGDWYIETCYIGLTVDGDYSRTVPITYPDYNVTITSKGEISIYLVTEAGPELMDTGTVSGLSRKKLHFDNGISGILNTIGYFEADNLSNYSIINYTGTGMEINYTFKNSSGKPQDEGFYLYKLGVIS
jgi:hypothetical protein